MACPLRVVTDPRGGQGLGGELWRRELEATGDFRGRGGNPEKGAPLEPFPETFASPARSARKASGGERKMPDCGFLTANEKDAGFKGKIRTLGHRLKIELQPNDDRRGDASPDFIVWAEADGDLIPIGSAWQKTVQARGANSGRKFLSISCDDPSFPAPLNVAAFEPDAPGLNWVITWNRPRQQGREAA